MATAHIQKPGLLLGYEKKSDTSEWDETDLESSPENESFGKYIDRYTAGLSQVPGIKASRVRKVRYMCKYAEWDWVHSAYRVRSGWREIRTV